MIQGILFALAACFIWGLIFVVPQFMAGFSSIEIALGRYFTYGIASFLFFIKGFFSKKYRYPFSLWKKTLLFSFMSTIGYYACVVIAMRNTSPAICALILGLSPIIAALYGNWSSRRR